MHISSRFCLSCTLRSLCLTLAALGTFQGAWAQSAPAPAAAATLPASTRLALPGAQHQWLNPLVGQWAVEMFVYPAPGQAPIVSKDMSAKREWLLDGRYLREELQGTFAGYPSSRIAVLSFNNLDERWELSTVDSFEPGQMWYAGRSVGSPGRFELHGESTEAGLGPTPTGRKRDLRFEFEITDANKHVQRIYVKYPGAAEQLFVEQRFTRVR
jgi:hypothetical protein